MTLGRRGAALTVFAGLDIAYAVRLLTVDPDGTQLYAWLHSLVPLWVPAVAWALAAVMCLAYAGRHVDWPAFVAAVVIKQLWAVMYLVGWATGVTQDGWVSACTWTAFAAIVVILAGWAEPVAEEVRPWTRR